MKTVNNNNNPLKGWSIFIDFDGTLLRSDSSVSLKTIKIINYLNKKGVNFHFITGRSYPCSKPIVDLFDFKKEFFVLNGAMMYKNDKSILVDENNMYLKNEIFVKILNVLNKHTEIISFGGVDKDNLYISNSNTYFIKHSEFHLINEIMLCSSKEIFEKHLIYLISFIKIRNENIKILEEKLNNIKNMKYFYMHVAAGTQHKYMVCEFQNNHVDKVKAIKQFVKNNNLDEEKILFFGDYMNDKESLKYVKKSILMKNGTNQLKKYAKYVTKFDNNNDGIALFLKEFFEIKTLHMN